MANITKINLNGTEYGVGTDTDTKTTQTNTTDSANYRILMSQTADNTTRTEGARKSANFYANPSTGAFYSKAYKRQDLTGKTLDINTLNLSSGTVDCEFYVEKTDGGSNNITNIPVAGKPFILDVELVRWASTTDYITRQSFRNANNPANEYVRYCTNGTWGSWTTRVFTDTHWTTHLYAGSGAAANAATTNGNTKITVTDNSTVRNSVTVKGTGATSVTSDANGVITVNSTNTTYGVVSKTANGLAPQLPNETTTTKYLRQDGTWVVPPNTTYSAATQSAAGLMSADDKKKLDGIASGAQVNSVTGVKGNGESTYRTGNVNITKANVGLGNVENLAQGKAIKSITRSGTTFTYTCLDGTTGTFTQQDNNTDTKNTAGSTDTSSKIFLIGATSQAANPQTYSHDTAYVGTDGCLYSGGVKVLTAHQDISGKVSKSGDTMTGRLTTTKAINQIITGSGTAASDKGSGVSPRYFPAKWTFNTGANCTNGDIYTIKIPVAGHDYGVFMSVNNGTNYYPIVLNGTARLTTHYPNATYIQVIFESSASAASMFPLNGGDARKTVTGGAFRVINYKNDNTDIRPSAYCETAADTAAKAASCTNYSLLSKSYLHVLMIYANTSQTALTLNVNGKGAKPIYINGSASSASNYTLPAGTYLVYYNGTNYYFRTDGKITGDITGNAATVGGHTVAKDVPSDAKFTDTTYSAVSKTANGLCPQLPNETTTTKYLRQDGTWQVPPDTKVTVDSAMSTSSTNPVQNKVVNTAITTAESNAKNLANATGTLAIGKGGTGATTRLAALKALTNENVSSNANYFLTITTNWAKGGYTSVNDAKTVLGMGDKANLASPTFTGTPKAPTAASGTNSTQIATTEFVNNATSEFFAKSLGRPVLMSGGVLIQASGKQIWERSQAVVMLTDGTKITVMPQNCNSTDIDIYRKSDGTQYVWYNGTLSGFSKYIDYDSLITTDGTGHSTATQSTDGLMSAADKTKLDGIATGANKTTVDSALSSTSTNPVQNKVINTALAGKQATLAVVTDSDSQSSVYSWDAIKVGRVATVTFSGQTSVTLPTAFKPAITVYGTTGKSISTDGVMQASLSRATYTYITAS